MFKVLFKILKLAQNQIALMLLASLIGFFTIGSSIGLVMTSAYIIAKAALHPSIAELQIAIIGVRVFGISRGIFRYLERYISHDITFNIIKNIRIWFFKMVDAQFPIKTGNIKSSDLLNKSVSNIEELEVFFVRLISPPLIAFCVFILLLILFSTFSIKYAIVAGAVFLISAVIVPFINFSLRKNVILKIAKYKKQLTELSIDQLQGMTELLVYGGKEKFLNKLRDINKKYIEAQRKLVLINSLSESLNILLMYLAVILLLIIAIPDVTSNILDGVLLSVITLGLLAFFEAVLPLPLSVEAIESSYHAAKEIFEFEEKKTEQEKNIIVQPKFDNYSIKINKLNFSYEKDITIYRNLDLQIPQNKVTALIGESGAGKSTITNILLKRWKDYEGNIFIGNTNLKNIEKEKIPEIITILPQNIHLFNLSIKENLRFANLEASDDGIIEVMKKVNLYDYVKSLPNGYNEIIGEFGIKLSGGEKQRLGIAQSLLRSSPIMIFDEPTSNLDKYNSKIIMDLIYDLSKTKTILLITHDLNNLERVDKINLLRNGNIIEAGSFNSLMLLKKDFYNIYQFQKKNIA